MYKDADGRLYTREELDAAPGDLLTEYVPPCQCYPNALPGLPRRNKTNCLKHGYASSETDEATRMQMVYDWLSQTISGLEEDEGYVRLADVLAAIPNTGDDSLWFSGAEWQSIINEKNDLQERLETLRGEKIAIEGELARARQTIGAMENFARHPRCEDCLDGKHECQQYPQYIELPCCCEKDIRTLNARTGKVIDARNAFVAGASTAEQLCDKIDAALFGDSLSEPNPPSFHPNLVAFAPEEI